MIQNKEIQDAYYKLLLDIRKSNPEEAIIKLTEFYDKNKNYDEDHKIKNGVAYNIANTLKKQGKLVEALEKFRELLNDLTISDAAYNTTLVCTLEILTKLNRKAEAIDSAKEYLSIAPENSFYLLNILVWHTKNTEPSDVSNFEMYWPLVNKISRDLEIDITETDIKKSILQLHEKNHRSNKNYSDVMISYGRIPNEEFKRKLKAYVDSEKTGYYKHLALKNIAEM